MAENMWKAETEELLNALLNKLYIIFLIWKLFQKRKSFIAWISSSYQFTNPLHRSRFERNSGGSILPRYFLPHNRRRCEMELTVEIVLDSLSTEIWNSSDPLIPLAIIIRPEYKFSHLAFFIFLLPVSSCNLHLTHLTKKSEVCFMRLAGIIFEICFRGIYPRAALVLLSAWSCQYLSSLGVNST